MTTLTPVADPATLHDVAEPDMRIATVEATWVQIPIDEAEQHTSDFGRIKRFDAAIVRIETEGGLVGWGEAKNAAGSAGTYAAVVELVNRELAPILIGQDARNISWIWDQLYSGGRAHYTRDRGHVFPELSRRGITIAGISGVDIALWDILGKLLGAPVWQLLGGRKAAELPAYASGGWMDLDRIGEQVVGYVEQGGFTAVKMRVGAMDGSVKTSALRVHAAREALGDDIDLMCDAHGTWTVAEAKRFCHMVADCDLAWFEEPVSCEDKRGMAEVRAYTHIPIAAGESEFTRFDFKALVDLRAVDVLQPDLAVCGGITETQRIGGLAASHNLQVAPHLWAGALAFAAGLHFCAASTASFMLEYSLMQNPMLHNLTEEGFPVNDGMIAIPDGPGLGVTVREDVVAEFAHTP